MPARSLTVHLRWRRGASVAPEVRRRVEEEVRRLAGLLDHAQLAVHEATRMAGVDAAFTMPRLELRLPLFDLDARFRLVVTDIDGLRVRLVDAAGEHVADATLP